MHEPVRKAFTVRLGECMKKDGEGRVGVCWNRGTDRGGRIGRGR